MFESVDGQMHGRMPARLVNYKLTMSLRLRLANNADLDQEKEQSDQNPH